MRFARGFSYMTSDPGWVKKVLIGSIVTSIPFVEAISDGYQIQTIKNLRAGHPRPLPEWDDVSGYFKQGLGLRLVIYAVYVPTLILTALALFMKLFSIYRWLFVENQTTAAEIGWFTTLGKMVALPVFNFLILLLLPIVFLVVPAMARRLADGHSVLSLFNPIPTLRLIFSNFSIYVMSRVAVFILMLAVGFFTSLVTGAGAIIVIGPLLGWLLLAVGRFWGRLMWAFYLAQMKAPWERNAYGAPPQHGYAPQGYYPDAPRM